MGGARLGRPFLALRVCGRGQIQRAPKAAADHSRACQRRQWSSDVAGMGYDLWLRLCVCVALMYDYDCKVPDYLH